MNSNRPKSYIIQTDGKIVPYFPKNGDTFTLDEIYFAIKEAGKDYDPMFQLIQDGDTLYMMEENAIMLDLQSNFTATVELEGKALMDQGGIRGAVLVCHSSMME